MTNARASWNIICTQSVYLYNCPLFEATRVEYLQSEKNSARLAREEEGEEEGRVWVGVYPAYASSSLMQLGGQLGGVCRRPECPGGVLASGLRDIGSS